MNIGISKGDRILLVMPNIPHFVFSYMAILQAGCVAVPVNFLSDEGDIQRIIEETSPRGVICWNRFWGRLNKWRDVFSFILLLGDNGNTNGDDLLEFIAKQSEQEPSSNVDLADNAVVYYTPGISQISRGVVFTHRNIVASVKASAQLFRVVPDDHIAAILPFFHVVTQHTIVNTALAYGASIQIYEKSDPAHVQKAAVDDGVTIFGGSSVQYRILLSRNLRIDKQVALKDAFSFGDFLELDTIQKFKKLFGVPILHGYSVTEGGGLVSINRMPPDYKDGSVGFPIPGMHVRVVDENGVDLRANNIGESLISGDMVADGYISEKLDSRGNAQNGWIRTGDLMLIDNEGFLHYITRRNDLILKSGFQIFPEEIEQVLLMHPAITQAAVIAIRHQFYKEDVKACVILKEGQKATAQEIIDFCKQHIPIYKCPQIVEFYNTFPKSPTGKVLKRVLRESF